MGDSCAVAAAAIAVLEVLGRVRAGQPAAGGLVAGELAILIGIYGSELDQALDELVERGAIARHRGTLTRYTLAEPKERSAP